MTFRTVVVVALLVVGCGGSAVESASSDRVAPPASSHAPDPTATLVPPTPAVSSTATPPLTAAPTTAATIGKPADSGARIIGVTVVDDRTRDLTIESPAVGTVAVRLLVPDGFDEHPKARWPTLYLLHGSPGTHVDWMEQTDVATLTEPTNLLVAMPDGGDQGWYSDWWNGGNGGRPMWERFHTEELPQLIERNWQGSGKRAIAGLSMGGYGAMEYAARHPGMYRAAASYSGALDPIGSDLFIEPELWGDKLNQENVWKAHDPVNIAADLKGTDLYVSYGYGPPGPLDTGPLDYGDIEAWIYVQNRTFVARLKELGISVTVDEYGRGSHTWPYWERALHRSLPMLLKSLGE